jgi:hypothetical protein
MKLSFGSCAEESSSEEVDHGVDVGEVSHGLLVVGDFDAFHAVGCRQSGAFLPDFQQFLPSKVTLLPVFADGAVLVAAVAEPAVAFAHTNYK